MTYSPPHQLAVAHAKQQLKSMVVSYLSNQQVDEVMNAADYADQAHAHIMRKSGEPYILHPIAVAHLLSRMQLDAETLIAALLHDVIEDTPITKQEVAERYSDTVAHLVDGVTKLTASSDKQYNKAASFRKFLQATLHDPRVLVIKLADRYHNMTTLDALRPDKRKRIAQETFEVYVPMARLAGINEMADWLEDLCYQNLDIDMYATVKQAINDHEVERTEQQQYWQIELTRYLEQDGTEGQVYLKDNNTELLRLFFNNQIDLQQLVRSYAFDIVVSSIQACDELVKILSSQFEQIYYVDHIRKPLPGGNQALFLALKTSQAYLSLTIQTELMRQASRFGVVLGDAAPEASRSAIQASLHNLNHLIDKECARTTFNDLLDYLHQEKVIAYTPHGHLHELPRGATAVDFAYAASLFLGHHAISCRINGEQKPLSTPIANGQVVEIITDVLATPNPDWLSFVNTQKARRAIQNVLRNQDYADQILIGEEALDRALRLFNGSVKQLTADQWQFLLDWRQLPNKDALFEQIALGDLLPQLVANKLFNTSATASSDALIEGTEGIEVKYAHCCHPVYGDPIVSHLTRRGLIIHRIKCHNIHHEQHQHPANIMPVTWRAALPDRMRFNAFLRLDMLLDDEQISQAIYTARKINAGVENVFNEQGKTFFSIVISDRNHIAQVIREWRMLLHFPRIKRLLAPINALH